MYQPMIAGIGGSTGAMSVTTRLLRRCLEHAERLGARTAAVTPAQLAGLPIYSVEDAPPSAPPFVDEIREADCVVIATPGYHGGMSGLVKNALDHLEALRDDPRPYLDGRAVGVIVGASGWQACGTTLMSVRSAIHALRGWPTPFGVTVNTAEQHPDADGNFGEVVDGALAVLAGQLVEFAGWRASASGRAGGFGAAR
jgi:FMN reductase